MRVWIPFVIVLSTLTTPGFAQRISFDPLVEINLLHTTVNWKNADERTWTHFSQINSICPIPVPQLEFQQTLQELPDLARVKLLHESDKRLRQLKVAAMEALKEAHFRPVDCIADSDTQEDARLVFAIRHDGKLDWRLVSGPTLNAKVYGELEAIPFAGPGLCGSDCINYAYSVTNVAANARKVIDKVKKEIDGHRNKMMSNK